MKLAEALILRADQKTNIQQLIARLNRVAKVQEGVEPVENPQTLIVEVERVSAEQTLLIQRINRTNTQTELASGKTLADALAERDALKVRHSIYKNLARQAGDVTNRYSAQEIRTLPTVDVAGLEKTASAIALQHRELDSEIQALNWTTELAN